MNNKLPTRLKTNTTAIILVLLMTTVTLLTIPVVPTVNAEVTGGSINLTTDTRLCLLQDTLLCQLRHQPVLLLIKRLILSLI